MREVDALLGATVDLGHGRQSTLLELAEGWAGHVHRLFEEHAADPPPHDAWGLHDYVAALYVRDRVERALSTLGLAGKAPHVVRVADELFRSFTAEDDDAALQRYPEDLPTEPWWWGRIPISGPVAVELHRTRGTG